MRAVEKRLRERVKALENELAEVKDDREQYRGYWIGKMKWFLELHGNGKSPSLPWLIEDLAKLFNRVERFYW